jgi:hypothetical protein
MKVSAAERNTDSETIGGFWAVQARRRRVGLCHGSPIAEAAREGADGGAGTPAWSYGREWGGEDAACFVVLNPAVEVKVSRLWAGMLPTVLGNLKTVIQRP